jgi:hypothetical protein
MLNKVCNIQIILKSSLLLKWRIWGSWGSIPCAKEIMPFLEALGMDTITRLVRLLYKHISMGLKGDNAIFGGSRDGHNY